MTTDISSDGLFARVVIDAPIGQPLDYRLGEPATAGQTCVVPVGRGVRVGLIVEVTSDTTVDAGKLRDVLDVVPDVTPLAPHWLAFTRFAAEYYQRAWGEVALPALPPVLRSKPGPRFPQTLARLRRSTDAPHDASRQAVRLTPEQARAVDDVTAARGFGVHLLFGITGSGKTEVYLHAIEQRLRDDPRSQVLLLVPEINLTPQLDALLRARFGDVGVVTLHSAVPAAERSAAWLAAHEGRARIVVGTRLAVFASLPDLALIVVDEEHDPSYKAGEGVRYSARDLAIKRAQMLAVPIVLGSATPSLDSWLAGQSGRYRVLRLTQRASDETGEPPTIALVDQRAEPAGEALTQRSVDALREVIARNEQALVFLNRRGYAPVIACDACGWLSRCPQCSTFSVFHKVDRTLRCHHCGHASAVPRACPTCGNQALHGMGQGTQRIEETLQTLLPAARVMRIDRDSTRRRHAAEQAFDAVHAGDVDVLVGTQMIAKGHDFQRVSLVIVLNPDGQLASHDFRAPERMFATLTQVAGRAGRGGHASQVIVQTRYPQHPLFAALLRNDYAAFADSQLAERRTAGMPPYTHQALVTAEARTMDRALGFLREARAAAPEAAEVRLYDPVPMALQRLAGVDRAQLLVEADRRAPLQAFLRTWLVTLRAWRQGIRWQVEVDPQEI